MVLLAPRRSQYNRKIRALFFNAKNSCVGGRGARAPAPQNANKPMRFLLSQKLARRVAWPSAYAHVRVCNNILYSACTMHPSNFCNNDPPLPHTTRRPSTAHKNGTRARVPVGTGVPVRLWCGEREKRSEKFRTSFLLV